ncbi:hypothetical protein CYMTET_48467 [Cymbomonas tetramitiformis]|uniref:Pyrroloquinoline quinone-dependent pyranose dehydrogenase beta-propeller domain-containing protein n=1 Tax=Cymbomonas tetramitiformis TaxID=36881 RepID=A0AAE0BU31_9CHLO|nr:hypothetical protein CYMTET_48467 [Cymbomonas tetramitiformis]
MSRPGALLYALTVLLLRVWISSAQACSGTYPDAATASGLCVAQFAQGLQKPRGMWVASNEDVLVVERDSSRVSVLWDGDGDGASSESERAVLAEATGLNHGIAVAFGSLYASSDTVVYRWAYTEGTRSHLGSPTTVVHSMNADGNGGAPQGHWSRTLAIDSQARPGTRPPSVSTPLQFDSVRREQHREFCTTS